MFDVTPYPELARGLFAAGAVVLVWLLVLHGIDSAAERDTD